MIDMYLGARERSIVEIDVINGYDPELDEPLDVAAITDHYARTRRLLVEPTTVSALCELLNGVGEIEGDRRTENAASNLASRARRACRDAVRS